MALHGSTQVSASFPCPADVLKVLGEAMGDRPVSPHRVAAASDSRSTEEGLALLGAYVTIEDSRVRQAILDAVLTISAGAR